MRALGIVECLKPSQHEQVFCMHARICALQGQPAQALEQAQLCAEQAPGPLRLRTYLPALVAYAHAGAPALPLLSAPSRSSCSASQSRGTWLPATS